jgi:hypothetical protein
MEISSFTPLGSLSGMDLGLLRLSQKRTISGPGMGVGVFVGMNICLYKFGKYEN